MKCRLEQSGALFHRLQIEIAPVDLIPFQEKIINNLIGIYKTQNPTANSPTEQEIKQKFLRQIERTVQAQASQAFYEKALELNNLKAATEPDLKFGKYGLGASLQFSAEFEIIPNIRSIDTGGIFFNPQKVPVTEAQIDLAIQEFLKKISAHGKPNTTEAELPQITDSLVETTFKNIDSAIKSVENLRLLLREQIQDVQNEITFKNEKSRIFDELIRLNVFEVPQKLVEKQYESLVRVNKLKQKSPPDSLRLKETAKNLVRLKYIFEWLLENFKLTCDRQDLEAWIAKQARRINQDQNHVRVQLQNPEAQRLAVAEILEDKLMLMFEKKQGFKASS